MRVIQIDESRKRTWYDTINHIQQVHYNQYSLGYEVMISYTWVLQIWFCESGMDFEYDTVILSCIIIMCVVVMCRAPYSIKCSILYVMLHTISPAILIQQAWPQIRPSCLTPVLLLSFQWFMNSLSWVHESSASSQAPQKSPAKPCSCNVTSIENPALRPLLALMRLDPAACSSDPSWNSKEWYCGFLLPFSRIIWRNFSLRETCHTM